MFKCRTTAARAGEGRFLWDLRPFAYSADSAFVEVRDGAERRTAAEETTGWFSSYGVRLASRHVEMCRTAQTGQSIITTITTT
jgi:hypothetical protein